MGSPPTPPADGVPGVEMSTCTEIPIHSRPLEYSRRILVANEQLHIFFYAAVQVAETLCAVAGSVTEDTSFCRQVPTIVHLE